MDNQAMNKGILTHIRYTKLLPDGGQEITERAIVPTQVPVTTIRGMDVSDLTDRERAQVIYAYAEYQLYVQSQMSKIFNFETWLEHTGREIPTPKWRAFHSDQTELLDE